jgi:hypothetical protein
MASRLNLQKILEAIPGVSKVYYQPPESVKLVYPCIIYEENRGDTKRADDALYLYRKAYSLLVIDKNPDSDIPEKIVRAFSGCVSGRNYQADNLNHFVLYIYY